MEFRIDGPESTGEVVMRNCWWIGLVFALVGVPACQPGASTGETQAEAAGEAPSKSLELFSVDVYDPGRDPAADLKEAVQIATSTNRRILLEVGGEWCSWCHALDRFLTEQTEVREALAREFVMMKVNMSEENRNEEFLGQFPEIPGYPHLFVLDQSGALLQSQGTAELEQERSYSVEAFLALIEKWKG